MKPISLRNQLVITVLLVLAMSLIYSFLTAPTATTKNYSAFQKDVTSGLVTEVERNGTTLTVTLKDNTKYTSESDTTQTSQYTLIQDWLTTAGLKSDSISYKVDSSSDGSLLPTLLFTVLPFLVIGGFLIIILRQAQRGNNQALGFGKSKARLSITPTTKITFDDVAGVDEAKADLQEVVEFLKYPEKFESLGAKIPRGVLLVGAPGTGKCITGDSLILTDRGLIQIADIPQKYAVSEKTNEVAGGRLVSFDLEKRQTTKASASHWYDLGVQPTRRIRLEAGMEIEGTPEHPILIIDKDGNLKFQRLDETKQGDQVAIISGTQQFGSRRTVDESTAYIMGLLTGDGCLTIQHRVIFSSADPELVEIFSNWIGEKLGGKVVKIKNKSCDYAVFGWEHKKAILDTGLSAVPSWLKEVPASILEAPKEIQVAFLRGLFDADGWVETGTSLVGLSTSSPRLGQQVVAMLLNFGIEPRVHQKSPQSQNGAGRPATSISLSGRSLSIFAKQINFGLTRKQNVLKGKVAKRLVNGGTNLTIPNIAPIVETAWKRLSEANHSHGRMAATISHIRTRQRVTRNALLLILESFRKYNITGSDVDYLERLSASSLNFSPVIKIKESQARVYDFTVPKTHNFIANGLISHNTLMAKAVAGEANVPFLSISGSEFVELFVGVGASRVRDTFDQAKRNSPAIIFIDEVDAIGRHRGSGLGNSNDEREQTLNQILVEMDGFDSKSNVIVIAATNRPDILDPALLRPGRFDRQVILDKPDVRGRLAILQVHVKGKPLDKDVNLETLAHLTIGFSGADLANLTNEGAILAARNGHKVITQSDLTAALDRIAIGPERKSRLISDEEKRIIAIHEGGHALVQRMLPKCDPVSKVTILGRGMALGFTASLPAEDRYLQSRSEFRDKLAGLLAGNTAEKIMLGDTTTGASNDIEKATQIARAMVTKFGMSEKLGPITFGRTESSIFFGREVNEQRDYSDSLANQIDQEIKVLMEEGQRRAHEVVVKYRELLSALVDKLIVVETLEAEEFEKLFVGLPKDLTI